MKKISRRSFLKASGAGCAAALLAACGGNSTGGNAGGAGGNSGEPITNFVDWTVDEIETFFFLNSESSADSRVLSNAYSPLLEVGAKGEFKPAVATEWGTEDGGLTWTFKLRDDVTWVDVNGNYKADCTAQDWVTAMEWILNFHKNGSRNTSMTTSIIQGAEEYYEYTKSLDASEALALKATDSKFKDTVGVEAPDDYTLIYHCCKNAPYFETMTNSACMYPISQAQIDEMGVENMLAQNNLNMWYNGAYTVTEYIQNNSKTLTRNPAYWDKDCTLFDTVTILTVEDRIADDNLFMSGELDRCELSEARLRIIYEDPDNEWHNNLVQTRTNKSSAQFHLNYAKNNEDGTPDTNWNNAIANEAFRKSLYYGMDLTSYWSRTDFINPQSCENLAYTVPDLVHFSDGRDYVDRVVELLGQKSPRYDAELAKQYKEQAMKELAGKVTFPVTIVNYVPAGVQDSLDSATVLKEIVEALGTDYVQMEIKTYAKNTVQEVFQPRLHCWSINGWGADYGDPENFLKQEIYGDDSAFWAVMASNVNDITDPELIEIYKEFTTMVEEASAICDDMDARYEAFAQAEVFLLQHALTIPCNYKSVWSLTKVNTYSTPFAAFGGVDYQYKNWETSTVPYTSEEYAEFEKAFNA